MYAKLNVSLTLHCYRHLVYCQTHQSSSVSVLRYPIRWVHFDVLPFIQACRVTPIDLDVCMPKLGRKDAFGRSLPVHRCRLR